MEAKILVEKYGLKISGLARRMLNDPELAKDATQEVWYEVFKNLNSFKGESHISTWIYTVAKRTILKFGKSEKLITKEDVEHCVSKGQIPYDDEENKEEWIKEKCDACITAFCHCLNNESRLIFLFRENLQLSYEQISKIMEINEENVRKIASRSLRKVRSFLNNDCILFNPEGNCGCRIREVIKSIDYDRKYEKIREAYHLVDFLNKLEEELPRKNYWEKFFNEVVTNE